MTISTPTPNSAAILLSSPTTSSEFFSSSAPVGSSQNTILGFIVNARAIDARCSSPPESVEGYSSVKGPRPNRSSISRALSRASRGLVPDTTSGDGDVGGNGEIVEEGRELEDEPARRSPDQRDLRLAEAPDVGVVTPGDRATVRLPEACEGVEQRRLPGAAHPHHSEDLALAELHVDIAQDAPFAKALGQSMRRKGWGCGRHVVHLHRLLALRYGTRGYRATVLTDIPHIRLRGSKEPAILHNGDGRGIHERRQLSRRAHKTISRCRELASAWIVGGNARLVYPRQPHRQQCEQGAFFNRLDVPARFVADEAGLKKRLRQAAPGRPVRDPRP